MLSPDYSDLLSAFRAHEVRFLVVGAHALGFHGRPRATMDFDVWVEPSAENAPRVIAALRAFGAPVHGMSEQDFSRPGVGLQIGVAPFRVDILTLLSGIEFEQAWPRRVAATLGDQDCFVISPRDMLTNKLAAGRPKDLADASALQELLKSGK